MKKEPPKRLTQEQLDEFPYLWNANRTVAGVAKSCNWTKAKVESVAAKIRKAYRDAGRPQDCPLKPMPKGRANDARLNYLVEVE